VSIQLIKLLDMKKTLTSLFLSLVVCVSFAQTSADSSKHLAFKGIPLDGTLDQYVSKMKANGFEVLKSEGDLAMLKGDFAGYKDCYVGVSTLKQKGPVHKIGVFFPEKDKWSTLSGDYFNLKQLLTEKYGNPTKESEKFDRLIEPRDDNMRMHEVRMDRCKYFSIWDTDKGEIQLSIDHDDITGCNVRLVYIDKINSATVRKQALEDL
jgi:hypothetical protein